MEKLIFRNLNIKFGEKGEGYFVEDECARIYLTADDIDRISTADVNGRAKTISARYGCDGAECLIAESVKSVHKAVQVGQIGEGRQGERIYDVNDIACTQTSISGGLGGKTGLYGVSSKVRKLTPRECARVMGFPDDFKIVVSDSQAYKQFGNAVVPGVVECIAGSVLKEIEFKNTRPNKKSRKTKIEYNPLFDAALNTMRNNFLYRMG